jgi:hypothetical protein
LAVLRIGAATSNQSRVETWAEAGKAIGARRRSRQHNPTPEERDERVKLPLDPETAIEVILATGPHRDEDRDS